MRKRKTPKHTKQPHTHFPTTYYSQVLTKQMWPKQFVCIFSSLLNLIIFNVPPKTTIQSNPGRIKIDNNDFTGVEKWRPPELRA